MIAARSKQLKVEDTGIPLQQVSQFVYLGRVVTTNDKDIPALRRNLTKARKRWGLLRRTLVRAGATPKISGYFYKAACQSVLLYASETWTWTGKMLALLESFHNQVARHLSSRPIRRRRNANGEEVWFYPNINEARDCAGLRPISEYARRRRDGLLSFAQTDSSFYSLVLSLPRSSKQSWWKQHQFLHLSG
jgi:hypothetical protein